MFRAIIQLKQTLKRLRRGTYGISARERQGRQEFFYKAFKALTFNGITGDYLEFGCHGARTFALAYHEAARHKHKAKLWAFDSFQGLPPPREIKDAHPRWVEHALTTELEQFHKYCDVGRIPRDAYHVVPGFYDTSLPAMPATEGPLDIALAYIDCDLYSSTRDVLDFLWPRLKHGAIIAFDDYFCWSATNISGERMAMLEKLSESSEWRLLPYMTFGWHGLSFFVEDRKLAAHIPDKLL